MKNILLGFVSGMLGMLLSSYTIDATFQNESLGQELYLYNDGRCVIRTGDGRGTGTGTYDIRDSKIYFEWDNGIRQQGYVTRRDGQMAGVSIEGVNYSRRLVVSRSSKR